jgi:hypothetical protein
MLEQEFRKIFGYNECLPVVDNLIYYSTLLSLDLTSLLLWA